MVVSKPAKNKKKPQISGHLNFNEGAYLEATSQPLYALLFLLPLIVVYELGTLWVNTKQIAQTLVQERVVAFIWLSNFAEWIGMKHNLAWAFPGFVVVVILLVWHLVSRRPWNIHLPWIGWMALESVLLAVPLLAINAAIGGSARVAAAPPAIQNQSHMAHIVTGIGAGIYEELIFRLILIVLILLIMEDLLKIKTSLATIVAVIISAVLFSAHHYVGIHAHQLIVYKAEPFAFVSFFFRTAAGIYFALIFNYRGYGIIAGTHAAYNIILSTMFA